MSVASIQVLVKQMCNIQKHGGPDDEGLYTCATKHLVLGHRRLSLIDLSKGGHQPMGYDNDRYIITYNGELYNYIKLKEELKKAGCKFKNTSDTEVILAAFATWGTAAFQKFNGMFAFALLDNVTNDLFLVRDAVGIKPLYLALTEQGLAFASEVKAFKPIAYLQTAHPHWPVYLMAYGHLPEPITTLKDVRPLKKGHFFQYNILSGSYKEKEFKQHHYLEKIENRQDAVSLITETLTNAVKRHLIADAPVGVFLSGGLDSSILAHLANKMHPSLNTISLFFNEHDYSEKKYQDMVQQGLKGNQYQQLLREESFHKHLPEIIQSMDLPGCDGINTWFISKYAKECGLKAVLSGLGADELYGGYPSFDRIQATLLAQQLPNTILKGGSKYGKLKQLRRLCYLSIAGPVGVYLFLRGQFIPQEIATYLDTSEDEIWKILETEPQLPLIENLTAKNQASWIETNMYMQNQLLRDADVMSMAHGIEIRVPFLDAEFLKLSLQLSTKIKYTGNYKKQLLIDSFKDIIPAQIWDRPKMGFTFPFQNWLINDQYAACKTGSKIEGCYQSFVKGKLHWSQFLTVFLMENFINEQ